ncbi:MAG: hypothetical protein R3B41_00520 [Candidatus Doudnabacteria bacterium]
MGAIFLLIVGTLGFIIWQKSSSNDNAQTDTTPVVEQPQIEVPVEEPDLEPQPTGASKLTDDYTISPILTFRGDGLSYAVRSGQLYITDYSISNNTVLLSNKREVTVPPKSGISKILWPLVGNSYMVEFGEGLSKTWSFYNPDSGLYVDLPSQVKSVDWMPTGDKIMFTWVDGEGNTTLNLADPDTNNYQILTDLYEPDNVIHISPNGQNILFYRTQTANPNLNKINSVTPDGKTFSSVITDGYNTGVTWSPDSNKFLFTKLDPTTRQNTLWVKNLVTGELKSLGLNTSNVKAVWTKDSQSVIAAAQDLTAGQETIYKVDVVTNQRTEFSPGVTISAVDMVLSQNEDVLFFRNSTDNALYYIFLFSANSSETGN